MKFFSQTQEREAQSLGKEQGVSPRYRAGSGSSLQFLARISRVPQGRGTRRHCAGCGISATIPHAILAENLLKGSHSVMVRSTLASGRTSSDLRMLLHSTLPRYPEHRRDGGQSYRVAENGLLDVVSQLHDHFPGSVHRSKPHPQGCSRLQSCCSLGEAPCHAYHQPHS